MATCSDLSRGSFMRYNNELVQVLEYTHRTPGNLRAFYQVTMRNIKTGKLVENRFRVDESIDIVRVDMKEMQFLYKDGDFLVCMDNETFDQVNIPDFMFGDSAQYMKEGVLVKIAFDDATPVSAEAPTSVELEVTYTEPGVKGDTATRAMKPATVETGATVKVPLFVDTGEMIRVNPQTGEYLDRVK